MRISEFAEVVEALWPLKLADEWDRPGLSVGAPGAEINRVLLAVDLTSDVVDEAIENGCDLIFTHHPMLLRGVSTVAESTGKGDLVARLIRANIAVYSAHTNADVVADGVSDVLAKALGLSDVTPLVSTGEGIGHGRIGVLNNQISLEELARLLVEVLPATARGVAVSANPTVEVRTVALCGGAGDAFILDAKRLGADVYVTSDLRHHVVSEAGLPLIDVSHWASESLWLKVAAKQIAEKAANLELVVSQVTTDPWNFNLGKVN